MSEDKLKVAVEAVEKRFDALKVQAAGLGEKRAEIDRELAGIREEQIRLQGEYRALQALMPEKPVETTGEIVPIQ